MSGGVAVSGADPSPTDGRLREVFGVWLVAMLLHGGLSRISLTSMHTRFASFLAFHSGE